MKHIQNLNLTSHIQKAYAVYGLFIFSAVPRGDFYIGFIESAT